MTTEEKGCSIFISYAWGSEFREKEWIRQDIVSYLEWRYDVFWDRDTIALGDLVTDTISKGLAKRPLLVLCLCDQDYLEAAKRVGGGLHDELRMLAQIVDEPGVRVVPLILESGCSGCLPAPLADRLYLDLQPLYRLNLSISTAIWGVAEGLGQAQLQREINAELALFHLRQRALGFLKKRPLTIWGNGQNHQVEVQPDGATPYLLKPPQWMWDSNSWNYLLDDDEPTFCPSMGRWHWEHVQISTEMRPLGAAVISMFFPQFTEENEKKLLNRAATLLASKFFRMVEIHESFSFDVNDLVNNLTCDREGCNLLQQLLDAAGVTPAAG